MKILGRLGAAALCLLMSFPALAGANEGGFDINLRKGSYITLGSYMDEPIVWRCVGEDENGMLLISRDILCYKAFSSGSSRWDKSFLRTWLNSTDKNVVWGETAPDSAHTESNAYSGESGFLSGFSQQEIDIIKPVELTSVVNLADAPSADSGSDIHTYNSNGILADAVQNYSEAYSVTTLDRVFCPNIIQMETIASNYPSDIYASPRDTAVRQSGDAKNRESRSNNYYWLRDGIGNMEFPDAVRCVFPNGRVFFSDMTDGSMGVRPAIYVDSGLRAIGGKGYEAEPYIVAVPGESRTVPRGQTGDIKTRDSSSGARASVAEGDYILMGDAYGGDILWRCMDINENGPLMISDKIIVFRAFDAAGDHHNADRNKGGSNNWRLSTLRHWLNSDEPEGEKQWPAGNPPSSEKTGGSNGYSNEKGFLNFFTPEELDCVRPTTIRTITNSLDIDENTVGTQEMALRRNINNLSNSADAFASFTVDTFFLPSIDEAREMKESFKGDYLALPTPEAVNLNEARIDNYSSDMTVSWWLRDSDGQAADPNGVRVVTQDGWVDRVNANSPGVGVRPAFYLNMDTVSFVSGSGTYDDPYRVPGHSPGEAFVAQEPGCTEQGILRRVCTVCGDNIDEPIPSVGHSFGPEKIRNRGIFSLSERTCERCGEVHVERRFNMVLPAVGLVLLAAAVALAIKKRN